MNLIDLTFAPYSLNNSGEQKDSLCKWSPIWATNQESILTNASPATALQCACVKSNVDLA
jgi:hypothetical protein